MKRYGLGFLAYLFWVSLLPERAWACIGAVERPLWLVLLPVSSIFCFSIGFLLSLVFFWLCEGSLKKKVILVLTLFCFVLSLLGISISFLGTRYYHPKFQTTDGLEGAQRLCGT